MIIHCKYDELLSRENLKPHPKNRNEHPPEQIARLAQILKYQGWRYPIKISNLSGFVTSGHGRIEAAWLNGWNTVPVNYQDYENEEQEYADVVADNAIASWSELDLKAINFDLADLGPDFDIDLLGIEDFVLEPADKGGLTDENEVPEVNLKEARTKLGELYQLGEHRLLCGDSTDSASVARVMNGEKADMVFTSPPYNAGIHITTRPKKYLNSSDDMADYPSFLTAFSEVWLDQTNYLWVNIQTLSANMIDVISWIHTLKENLCEIAVWGKTNPPPAINENLMTHAFELIFVLSRNRKGRTSGSLKRGELANLFMSPCNSNNELSGIHNAMFPIALVENFLPASTGPLIADPFLGSGSALIACEKTNRKCYGMEIDPHYCDVILERWAKYTGKDPIREDGKPWSVLKSGLEE